MDRSPFAILGTTPDVSLPELKRIYRRLVRQWHPDRFHDDPVRQREAKERLSLINGAYRDCLALIAERQKRPPRIDVPSPVTPPPRRPAATPPPSPPPDPPSAVPLPRWLHLAAAVLLLLAWLAAGKRHPDDLPFRLGFFLLFTLIPAASGLWYLLGLIRGRLAVILYAGSTLVSLLSLVTLLVIDRDRTPPLFIPADRADSEPFIGRGVYPGPISPPDLLPSPDRTAPGGPVPPVVPAPAAPRAPIPPAAPSAPPAR